MDKNLVLVIPAPVLTPPSPDIVRCEQPPASPDPSPFLGPPLAHSTPISSTPKIPLPPPTPSRPIRFSQPPASPWPETPRCPPPPSPTPKRPLLTRQKASVRKNLAEYFDRCTL